MNLRRSELRWSETVAFRIPELPRVGPDGGNEYGRIDIQTAGAVGLDSLHEPATEDASAACISASHVRVSGSKLGQSFEELFVGRPFSSSPSAFPGLVGRKEPAGIEVFDPKLKVLFNRQRRIVVEHEFVLCIPS